MVNYVTYFFQYFAPLFHVLNDPLQYQRAFPDVPP